MNYLMKLFDWIRQNDKLRKSNEQIYSLSSFVCKLEEEVDRLRDLARVRKATIISLVDADDEEEEEIEWEEEEESRPLTADEKIDIHKIIKETEQGK